MKNFLAKTSKEIKPDTITNKLLDNKQVDPSKSSLFLPQVKPMSEIPGLPTDPVKGNINDINEAGNLATFQARLHGQYGTLAKFQLDSKTTAVSTTDPELLKKWSKLAEKPESLYQFLDPLIGNLLFLSPKEMQSLRELYTRQFSSNIFKENFNSIVNIVHTEAREWLSSIDSQNAIIKIQNRINALTMRITVRLVFGQDYDKSSQLAESIHCLLQASLDLQYKKESADIGKMESLRLSFFVMVNDLIEKSLHNNKEHKKNKNFIEDIFKFTDDQTKRKHIIALTLMGSYHTIGSTLAWTLYAIAKHPEVKRKVYQELDQLNDLMADKLGSLKYLNNVIKETLRIYPAGPYTARKASEPMQAGEYLIEEDTIIYFPIFAIHHDSTNWENPEKFDPDRFSKPINHQAYMPFGHGKRNCPGANLSNLILPTVIATFLQNINLIEVKNEPKITECFVLISENDFEIKISPHNRNNNQINLLPSKRGLSLVNIVGYLVLAFMLEKVDSRLPIVFLILLLCKNLHDRNLFFNKNVAPSANDTSNADSLIHTQVKSLEIKLNK